jgi:hypothetical protein
VNRLNQQYQSPSSEENNSHFRFCAGSLELNRKSKRKVLNYIELATITIGRVRTPQVPEGYIIFRVYFIVILLMQIVYYFKNVMLSSVNPLI